MLLEPAGREQVLQRLGMDGPHVRQVADVALEERRPARGIDRLEHDPRARPQRVEGGLERAHQVLGLEMLDHLRREEAAERSVPRRLQEAQDVGLVGDEAARAAHLDHLVIQVEPARRDAGLAQQVQELTTPAPGIEHVAGTRELRHVVG